MTRIFVAFNYDSLKWPVVTAVLAFLFALPACGAAARSSEVLNETVELPGVASPLLQAHSSDFSVIMKLPVGEAQKFITYGWTGFAGGIIRWRYDDTNRSASVSPSASSALNTIQTAMSAWSQACRSPRSAVSVSSSTSNAC